MLLQVFLQLTGIVVLIAYNFVVSFQVEAFASETTQRTVLVVQQRQLLLWQSPFDLPLLHQDVLERVQREQQVTTEEEATARAYIAAIARGTRLC